MPTHLFGNAAIKLNDSQRVIIGPPKSYPWHRTQAFTNQFLSFKLEAV